MGHIRKCTLKMKYNLNLRKFIIKGSKKIHINYYTNGNEHTKRQLYVRWKWVTEKNVRNQKSEWIPEKKKELTYGLLRN